MPRLNPRWSLVTALGLTLAMLAGTGAVAAAAPDAVVYELTESMTLDDLAHPAVRTAQAALQGTARVGSPLCPDVVVGLVVALGLLSGSRPCTITVIGADTIDLTSGTGFLAGSFASVIELDNAVDGPEFVIMTGHFLGELALVAPGVPLIRLTNGSLHPVTVLGQPAIVFGLGVSSFDGVFRLPFAVSGRGAPGKPRRGQEAFYLGDGGKVVPVRKDELSLGVPTVRVEVTFTP